MFNRLVFAVIVLFWIVMNVLLWRSEFQESNEPGSTIPVEGVWGKILTAPDDSALEITRRGEKIGYGRWRANVGEALRTGKVGTEEYQPDGMIKKLSGYTIDLEGNLLLAGTGGRIRFEWHGDFTPQHRWKEFTARAALRPQAWQVRSVAAEESVTLTAEDSDEKWERRIGLADLRDPGRLLQELGSPLPLTLLQSGLLAPTRNKISLGLPWEARNDWLKIGHSKVRVYRLQARLLDRYQIVVLVSRVGELLRVELPNEIVLVNDALINL